MQSQDDDSSIMAMGKDMDCLLTFLGDVEQEGHKCTSRCPREAVHVLSSTAEAERYIEGYIATDSIFCNKAVLVRNFHLHLP